ncbi:MAG TPA: FCD domain-containing protein [Burkholderiaceae bacterium]|nr:FCD domain-containing protein [Burkholderiaceae bacterium]
MDPAALLRETLLDKLKSGIWRAGHRIPTERALCTEYRLGRSAVRRVLGQLKTAGLITQTVGSGTYVSEGIAAVLPTLEPVTATTGVSPAELMAARHAIEPAIVEMVVRNATPADFARMAQCCEEAEQARSLEDFEHWDGLLHEAIAEAAHNGFIIQVFKLMNQARAQGEWGMLKRRSVTPERRAAYQREHRALVAALCERDLERALHCTRAHLAHVQRNLLGN